jgi:type IV pilus assembly protein PilE
VAADTLMNTSPAMRKRQSGVTLIELMVVVVIVGILASIAYPSYRKQVMRAKRADAKVALQQQAQNLENCFTRFHKYDDNVNCEVAIQLQTPAGYDSPDGNYKITVDGATFGDLVFKLVATPQAAQAKDTECGNFTLEQNNAHDVSGTKSATECWK